MIFLYPIHTCKFSQLEINLEFDLELGLPNGQFSNRPFSSSANEPGSSVIFIHFCTRARSSGVGAFITIVDVREFYKM